MEFMPSIQAGIDTQKPSLFELLSENQLSALIPPSLRYVLTIATHRRPRYLLRILNSFDEIYALFFLLIERYYLRTHGGSFTESFYGLKRERSLHVKGGELPRAQLAVPDLLHDKVRLTDGDIWKNLAVLVGIPYIKRKLDEAYDIHVPQGLILGPGYRRDDLSHDATMRQRILYYYKWFLRKAYPSINAAYYVSLLAFSIAYISDKTRYSSPLLWLVGARIRRMTPSDHRAIALGAEQAIISQSTQVDSLSPQPGTQFLSATRVLTLLYPRLLSSLQLLLPASTFALKFLEWWHASDFARQLSQKATEGISLPPPMVTGTPQAAESMLQKFKNDKMGNGSNTVALSGAVHGPARDSKSTPMAKTTHQSPFSMSSKLPIYTVPLPSINRTGNAAASSSLCPICLHPIQTPTSAQTGYVFCYTCIFKWIEGRHERQLAFMAGRSSAEDSEWADTEANGELAKQNGDDKNGDEGRNREGLWENGQGRCAVTGRRVLAGTDGLRRVMV